MEEIKGALLHSLPDSVRCIILKDDLNTSPAVNIITGRISTSGADEVTGDIYENIILSEARRIIYEKTGLSLSSEDHLSVVEEKIYTSLDPSAESLAIVMARPGQRSQNDSIHDHAGSKPSFDRDTGVLNRAAFVEALDQAVKNAIELDRHLAVVSMQINELDKIEELYGEMEARDVVRFSAEILMDASESYSSGADKGSGNLLGRIGKNEFAFILELSDVVPDTSMALKADILARFDQYNKISAKDYSVDPVLDGMFIRPSEEMTAEKILSELSIHHNEILNTKPQGRYTPSGGAVGDDSLRLLVNRILDHNELTYHFQPIISAKTGDIIGYEALMRTPGSYRISPLTLLKYATKEGRLNDVEHATFFNVLKTMSELKESIGSRLVFINSIPGHYIPDDEYNKLVKEYGDLFRQLVVEVTEETDVEENTIEYLSKRSASEGFKVAVDDFGTGYSNVSNLLKFLPNYVKIDRFLISEVHLDPRKQHFVNTIIQFAHDNGFQALAEGVETAEELRAVIRMGVDLVQGFYTAKPSPNILYALPNEILSEISKANLDMVANARQKVFLVQGETQVSLVDISLQKYNILLVADGDVTLVGNPDFVTAVSIRVKENANCRLTLKNVSIGDVDLTPCIDLGVNSNVTLNVSGTNVLNGNGIRVPESSSLHLVGDGDLIISPTFTNAYGIGNDHFSAYGHIVSDLKGTLQIDISGENCVCIGGKYCASKEGIDLRCGTFKSILAASNSVCIGSYESPSPVTIHDMSISIDTRVAKGAMIGSLYGSQKTKIVNSTVNVFGSGNEITAIGSITKTDGFIEIMESKISVEYNGWSTIGIGAPGGHIDISVNYSEVNINLESNISTGIGAHDLDAGIEFKNTTLDMGVVSANAILLGCDREHFKEEICTMILQKDRELVDKEKLF